MHVYKIFPFLLAGVFIQSTSHGQAQASGTDSLAFYRKEIDSLDRQMIDHLGKRMKVIEQIGKFKAQHQIPVVQSKRFEAILQRNILLGKEVNLSETFITELMHAIHEESIRKEYRFNPPEKNKE